MRRKIEKYISEKQGVKVKNIRYLADGRFDFMGDVKGVLDAVRGSNVNARVKGANRTDKKKSSSQVRRDKEKPMSIPEVPRMNPYPSHPHPSHPPPHILQQRPNRGMGLPHPHYPPRTPASLGIDIDGQMPEPKFNFTPGMDTKKDDGFPVFSPNNMTMNLSPPFLPAETESNSDIKDTFSHNLFSPGNKSPSMFSPNMNEMTPFSENFMKTPFTANANDLFLFSPQPELNRKLFAKLDVENSGNNDITMQPKLAKVSVSPIIDMTSVKKSNTRKRSFFNQESLKTPLQCLSSHVVPPSQSSSQSGICLGLVPLQAAMSASLSMMTQQTPMDLPFATPSVIGSAVARSDSFSGVLSSVDKTTQEVPSAVPKRDLFEALKEEPRSKRTKHEYLDQ